MHEPTQGITSAPASSDAQGARGGRSAAEPAADPFWLKLSQSVRQELEVAGTLLRPGSRVRLAPQPGGDLLDAALVGKRAIVDAIEEDDSGRPHLAVLLEDDPGRGLGEIRHPAHRFMFSPQEVEPDLSEQEGCARRRVLIAGIGNVFLGDDGFGVAVARELRSRELPPGVEVIDFGIRGRDLAFQLGQDYQAAILVDSVPGKRHPGTLVVLEPELEETTAPFDGHRMDPVTVLSAARQLGPLPGRVLIVGCAIDETVPDHQAMTALELTAPVAAAVNQAVELVQQLALHLVEVPDAQGTPATPKEVRHEI